MNGRNCKEKEKEKNCKHMARMNIHTGDLLKTIFVQRLSFSRSHAIASSIPF
jgi:hypothetical protein